MTFRSYQIVLPAGEVVSLAGVATDLQEELKFLQLVFTAPHPVLLGGADLSLGPKGAEDQEVHRYGIRVQAGVPLILGPFAFGAMRLSDLSAASAVTTTLHLLGIPA